MFILILILAMFIYVYICKGIDASFISAIMDTAIAILTALAIIYAKDYLAQFTAQEGYKIAIQLVNEHLIDIRLLESAATSALNLNILISTRTNFLPSKYDLEKYNELIDDFQKEQEKAILYSTTLNRYLTKLATYGIVASSEKKEFIDNLTTQLKNAIDEGDDLILKAQLIKKFILDTYNENKGTIYNYDNVPSGIHFSLDKTPHLIPNDKDILENYFKSAFDNYEKFISGDHSIMILFNVKTHG